MLAIMLVSNHLFSQTISKNNNFAISGAVCPAQLTFYSVTIPSGCTVRWSATNGAISGSTTSSSVSVTWNDTPGAKAIITATFTCTSNGSTTTTTRTLEELILSIKNQAWESHVSSYNLDFCTTNAVRIDMPTMLVQGTGGIGQPPRTEVVYLWTLPSGWKEYGTNKTGEVGTTVSEITIVPTACAKPGLVKVAGTLMGSGPFCNSAANSATATITLNGANPVATVGPQAGYTGASYCNTTPVTFYATPSVALGCISGYSWEVPASWTRISESGNSITLRPSGGPADSAPIKATISFSCGSTATGPGYTPPFKAPVISSTSPICGSVPVTVNNIGSDATINWNVSATLAIVSGQGTNSLVVGPLDAASDGGGVISATVTSCPAAPVPDKSVWVGEPVFQTYTFDGELVPIICEGMYQSFTGGEHVLTAVPGGTNSYPSFSLQTTSPYVRATPNGYNYNISVFPKNTDFEFIVRASASNGCGTKRTCTYFTNWATIVEPDPHPNPSNTETRIRFGKEGELKTIALYNSGLEQVFFTETTEKEVIIDTATFPEGMYVLRINADGKTISHHLQVKH